MNKSIKKPKISTFVWKGLTAKRTKVSGEIEATSPQQAKKILNQRRIIVKSISKKIILFGGSTSIKTNEVVFFTRQIATMMEAGITIAKAIRSIAESHESQAVKKLLENLCQEVESGTPFSQALKKHPKVFNQLYLSLVESGEESGTLDQMMNKISANLEKVAAIKAKIKSALFYPITVFVVAFVLTAVMLIFVIPEFEALFANFGSDLPALTAFMVSASDFFVKYWLQSLVFFVIGIVAFKQIHKRSESLQLAVDKMILRAPVFGLIIRKSIIALVCRMLSIMFGSGVPLITSLGTVSNASGNLVYRNAILQIRKSVSTGESLAESMASTEVFAGIVLQMTRSGEESGTLEVMLEKVADFYETEVDNAVSSISSLIEPFLIVFLGGIVGTIVVAMYLPIFQMGSFM